MNQLNRWTNSLNRLFYSRQLVVSQYFVRQAFLIVNSPNESSGSHWSICLLHLSISDWIIGHRQEQKSNDIGHVKDRSTRNSKTVVFSDTLFHHSMPVTDYNIVVLNNSMCSFLLWLPSSTVKEKWMKDSPAWNSSEIQWTYFIVLLVFICFFCLKW
jgi:hypothetical protein